MAVQGKLVEQRPEEGTVKELLAQIKAEKEQLIRNKKIKKEKPLPEITEEEIPFEIPESWEWVRLGDIVEMIMGQSPKGTVVMEGGNGIEFHQGKVFFGVDYLNKSNQTTTEPTKVVEPDTTLLCVRAPVGTVNITGRKVCIGRGLCGLNGYGGIESKFVLNWIRAFKNDFIRKATGTTFIAITGDIVREQIVPLPPLAEQKRIVAKIEELLPYIEQYDRAYTKLEAFNKKFPEYMKKSILQMAMQGKLVEQHPEEGTAEELYEQIVAEKARLIKEGKIKREKPLAEIAEDEIPFEIPTSWKWVSINDIAFVTKLAGFEYTKYMAGAIMPQGEVPIVRAKNVKPNSFRENENEFITMALSEQLSRCALDRKCVLMTFIGAGIGEVAVFDNIRRNHLAPNVAKIVPHVDINYFLMYYLMSVEGQTQVFQYMKQTAQPSLSMEVIRKVLIPLPPLAEQKRIVAKLEQMLPYCDQLVK